MITIDGLMIQVEIRSEHRVTKSLIRERLLERWQGFACIRISVERCDVFAENGRMTSETITTDVTKQELEELIGKLMRGEPRDPVEMKRSRERMEYMREETRKRVGTVEVAVEFIRELRDK